MSQERNSGLRNFAIAAGAAAVAYEMYRWAALMRTGEHKIQGLKTIEKGGDKRAKILTSENNERYLYVPNGASVICQIDGISVQLDDFKPKPQRGRAGDIRVVVDSNEPENFLVQDKFSTIIGLPSSVQIIYRNNNPQIENVMFEEGIKEQ